MAGYSGTPLQMKLGLKVGIKVHVVNPPPDYFDLISPLPEGIKFVARLAGEVDFIHLFVTQNKVFTVQFTKAKKFLKKDGMLWISWPKKASKVPTDLDENIIREFGLKAGLVDVKVCAVNEIWSGLKFVYRKRDRLT